MANEGLIAIPQWRDLVLPDVGSVREEFQDCDDYCNEVTARMRAVGLESLLAGRVVTYDDSAIANYGSAPQTGVAGFTASSPWVTAGAAGASCPPAQPRDGGTPQPQCNPLWNACGRVPLPINSIGKSGYPLVGSSLGTLTVGPDLTYTAGRAGRFFPKSIFFRALDQVNGLATVEGFLVNPRINGNPQLTHGSNTIDGSLTSAVNSLGFGPFAIDGWRPITNTEPEVLQLGWGHILAATSSVQFVGLIFGDASINPSGVQG